MELDMNLNLDEPRGWFNYAGFYDQLPDRLPRRAVVAEVGVWKGHGVSYLARTLPEATVWAVDLFEDTYRYHGFKKLSREVPTVARVFDENLRRAGVYHRVGIIKDYSWDAAARFRDQSFDFVFIDADHSAEAVRKDILAWWPKIKPSGLLAGHDYGHPNHPGVRVAVDAWVSETGSDLELHGNTVWCVQKDPP